MNKIAAIIVTYNCSENIKDSVKALKSQVSEIIIVDNGSREEILNFLYNIEKDITLIKLGSNKGIATALNEGIKYCFNKDYNWILTLDHDSIIDKDMIKNMLISYDNLSNYEKEKVAMIVPVHVEQKENFYIDEIKESGYHEVLTEITSGCMVKTKIYKNFRLYDESLFIDLVDHEYCLALNKAGYKIIQVKSAILIHNLGDSVCKKILGFKTIPTNHAPIRRYYMTRNRLYVWKKYKKYYPHWVNVDRMKFIRENIKIILFEEKKYEKFKMIIEGIKDYRKRIQGAKS